MTPDSHALDAWIPTVQVRRKRGRPKSFYTKYPRQKYRGHYEADGTYNWETKNPDGTPIQVGRQRIRVNTKTAKQKHLVRVPGSGCLIWPDYISAWPQAAMQNKIRKQLYFESHIMPKVEVSAKTPLLMLCKIPLCVEPRHVDQRGEYPATATEQFQYQAFTSYLRLWRLVWGLPDSPYHGIPASSPLAFTVYAGKFPTIWEWPDAFQPQARHSSRHIPIHVVVGDDPLASPPFFLSPESTAQ